MIRMILLVNLVLLTALAGCRPQPAAMSVAALPTALPTSLQAVQVVFLRSPRGNAELPALVSALCQQAILLAVREELGLTTRDEALGDEAPTPTDQTVATLQLRVDGSTEKGWTVTATLGETAGGREVCQVHVEVPAATDVDGFYPKLVERLEKLVRTELAQQLTGAGLRSQPRPPLGQTPLGPREVEDQESANVLRQWRALRMAHTAMVVAGPSPDLLAALARGYARLAWMHPEQQAALAARALLYAQRLKLLGGNTEVQQRYWCEALAAAGLHDAADAALSAGKFRDDAAAALQLACRFDVEKLADLWKKTNAPAIGNLWVLSLRTTPRLTLQRQRAAAEVLEREPGALHLAEGRWLAPPEADLAKQLGEWLPRFSDLPLVARQAMEQPRGLKSVLGNLIELGRRPTDRFEPSWTVLARRIQDLILQETLVEAGKRVHDGIEDVPSYVDEQAVLLRGHPGLPRLVALKGSRHTTDPTTVLGPLAANPPSDPLSCGQPSPLRLRGQLRQSSHHPAVLAQLLMADQEERGRWQAAAEEWGRAHAVVLEALADLAQKQQDRDAELAARKLRVAVSPDRYAYEQLAQVYLKHGQLQEWQATLETCVKDQPDLKDHAELLATLAREWLRRGEARRALPFGERAARTGQAVGLLCGIDCLTAVGQLERAEQLAVRFVRMRRNEPQVWLFWCLRTNEGNVSAAWQHVDGYLAGLGDGGNLFDWELRGVVALLRDKPEQADSAFLSAWNLGKQAYALQHLALVRLERKQSLDNLANLAKQLSADEAETAHVNQFMEWLTTPPPESAIAALRHLGAPARANQGFFLGRLFELHGQPDRAQACYRLSVDAGEHWLWNSLLAQVRLRRLAR